MQVGFVPGLTLWNTSPSLLVEKEELIYPMESLVAEFGGTLGLFLGFSFMAIWDQMAHVGAVFQTLKCKIPKNILE